jgi:biphenyl-2,3-diol 1,2-dioxygenase
MNHLELAYLVIETDTVDETAAVLADVVGLMPGRDVGDSRTMRNDDRAQRLVLQPGPLNDIAAIGFDARSADGIDALAHRLEALGYSVAVGSETDAQARRVEHLSHVVSPWGVRIELVAGQELATDALDTPKMPSGFLTGDMGFGHAVFFVGDLDEAHRFVVDGLGFRRSDSLNFSPVPGIDIKGAFYHCNGRHHTIALIQPPFPAPKSLHHVMVEVNDRDDVGAAFDRAFGAGVPLPNGLGRHPNDQMFSFYLETPAGFQIEVGYGGVVVDESWDADQVYSQISAWGHQPVSRPAAPPPDR